MLDWHGREKKAVWWEYFRFRDLSPQDLLRERPGLADITFRQLAGGTAKAPCIGTVSRYRIPISGLKMISGVSGAKSSAA
jgi:hypothetical protein